jgi:hypothetical protein
MLYSPAFQALTPTPRQGEGLAATTLTRLAMLGTSPAVREGV